MTYSPTAAAAAQEKNETEEALHAIPSLESLELLLKVTRNCCQSPGASKYRRLRLSNPRIRATLADVPEVLPAMRLMGWTVVEEGGESVLQLDSQRPDFKLVRYIDAAIAHRKREDNKQLQLRLRRRARGQTTKRAARPGSRGFEGKLSEGKTAMAAKSATAAETSAAGAGTPAAAMASTKSRAALVAKAAKAAGATPAVDSDGLLPLIGAMLVGVVVLVAICYRAWALQAAPPLVPAA